MPIRQFHHEVTPADTAAALGSGALLVAATPRLIGWCEMAAFQVCQSSIAEDRTTVGTKVVFEHVKGSPVGAVLTVHCAEPINDGRRLVCRVRVTEADGEEVGSGEIHRAVVDPDRFMSKCGPRN